MTIADEIFERWAPADGAWSNWAKPVLFAHVDGAPSATPTSACPVPGVPAADGATVLVVDLPGVTSVAIGVALATIGYRPVPLFNALPGLRGTAVAVDVWPIVDALRDATATPPPPRVDAPAAFLLDAARRVESVPLVPGTFDNRSLVLPTDFPSAGLLRSRGIARAIVVQPAIDARPQDDLAHVLLRWQTAGIAIQTLDLTSAAPRAIVVPRPRWYRAMWHAAIARLRLRPSPLGGFGGTLPMPSAG